MTMRRMKTRRWVKKRKQKGRGRVLSMVKGVYSTLKMAADHAKNMKKDNIFRKATAMRFGMSPQLMRSMYRYN